MISYISLNQSQRSRAVKDLGFSDDALCKIWSVACFVGTFVCGTVNSCITMTKSLQKNQARPPLSQIQTFVQTLPCSESRLHAQRLLFLGVETETLTSNMRQVLTPDSSYTAANYYTLPASVVSVSHDCDVRLDFQSY